MKNKILDIVSRYIKQGEEGLKEAVIKEAVIEYPKGENQEFWEGFTNCAKSIYRELKKL